MNPSEPSIPERSAVDSGLSVEIVHRTPRYVVVNKPAGLLSVPGKGEANQDCVVSRLREILPEATGPMVVHRLDMDTSGLLVLGLDPESQRELSMQFESRSVVKRYRAIVAGQLGSQQGVVDRPMRADIENRPIQIIDPVLGRQAITRWRLLALDADRSLAELTPLTGRTHQLRLHMASINHPILGDVLYGPQPATALSSTRLLLHASFLAFREPGNAGRAVEFSVEPRFPIQ